MAKSDGWGSVPARSMADSRAGRLADMLTTTTRKGTGATHWEGPRPISDVCTIPSAPALCMRVIVRDALSTLAEARRLSSRRSARTGDLAREVVDFLATVPATASRPGWGADRLTAAVPPRPENC